MSFLKDLKTLCNPHYVVNILLCSCFIALKTIYPICLFLFPTSQCQLDWREWEILTFLAIIVVFRTRRSGSTSMLTYLTASFMYCKVANLILFFYADPRMALCYAVLCLFQLLLLPEPPTYKGPENIVYFRGHNLKDEINSDRRVVWLIGFYAPWSPTCANFAPIFAELSSKYHLDNLKFGKLDVARYPDVAKEFYINDSSFSRQLPTISLFKNGKEVMRRPQVDAKGNLVKFYFTEGNIQADFDLNNLYQECLKNPLKEKKKKTETAADEPVKDDVGDKLKAE